MCVWLIKVLWSPKEHNRIVSLLLGQVHQAANVEVDKRAALNCSTRCANPLAAVPATGRRFEAIVILGNDEWPVVTPEVLQVGEGLVFGQRTRMRLLSLKIGSEMLYVHLQRLPMALFKQLHVVDALADQAVDIGPAGVTADHVEASRNPLGC
jgi:hypothetical protein